jgi:hypothetical protein
MHVVLGAALCALSACAPPAKRSDAISDEEFWALTTRLSETPGRFEQSDNLVSNEAQFAHTIRVLRPAGGVYVGVGPEQNFSYIARLRPELAFIVDIRRENLVLHLLYKALFERAVDRVDFVSRLFSRERPPRLDPDVSVDRLFQEVAAARSSPDLFDATLRVVREQLVERRQLPLSAEDLAWLSYALKAFATEGPEIDYYGRSTPVGPVNSPSYRRLMTAADMYGEHRSYLASDEAFAFVRDLHLQNRIVPLVGDFSGSHAFARLGDYLRGRGAEVAAFYASNVEVYLTKEQSAQFCRNLETLPSTPGAWFIDSKGPRGMSVKLAGCAPPPRQVTQ